MIVAGFGFREQASSDSLVSALEQASVDAKIDALAAPADKAQEASINSLAENLGLRVLSVSADVLENVTTPTQSAHSQTHRKTGSVAEAVALAAAGPGARLLRQRQISQDRCATCAIAIGTPK